VANDLDAFCDAAYPRLVAALAHHTGDRWLAEELAQDALIRACARWDRDVSRMASPLGWTFRVGVNLARSQFRRRLAERRALARHGSSRGEAPELQSADAMDVRAALALLPARQREAVVMRYVLDLSAAQVGAAMSLSPGAVRVLTHRAVTALRTTLDIDIDDLGVSNAS
jgi:RNA polymerase sigma factor (sigma-70 family)